MKVGQAAREVGVAASAVRYYEERGLLKPSGRSESGYRLYSPGDVDRLRFIRSAQAVGFTLEDIRALLVFDRGDGRDDVRRLLERRLADIDRKMSELKRVRVTLASALKRCRGSKDECPVLDEIRRPQPARSRR